MGRLPKGLNVGGMVGHCALRQYAMGERGIDQAPPTADDLATMTELLGEAMRAARWASAPAGRSCTGCPTAARCRAPTPSPTSCSPSPTCSAATAPGVFESASRIGEGDRDDADIPATRAEMAWMGEVSRRSGRPVSFGLLQHDSRPDLYAQVIELAKQRELARGQRAATDHGAQRRRAVQPRHAQPVRPRRLRGAS